MEHELVRFILARIDDDEREIKKLQKAANGNGNGNGTSGKAAVAAKAALPFPSVERMCADSAAKREIVGVLQRLLVLRDLPSERPVREGAIEVLRRMALPYENHTGYRAEWRPKRSGV